MARISKLVAERIAFAALQDAHAARSKANNERWHAVSQKAYEQLVPKPVRDWLAKAPAGDWLHRDSAISVRGSNGYRLQVVFKDPVPMPTSWRYDNNGLQLKDDKLTADLLACVQEAEKMREDWGKTKLALVNSILAAGTFKKLELAWPEGRAYFASYLNAENKTGTALTVDFASVNKTLGLPKDEKPAKKPRRKAA